MEAPRTHTIEHRVRFDDCDAGGVIRPSTVLRLVQDLAWRHSEAAGFDRAWYATHALTWLVRFVDLHIEHPVGYGDTLSLTTRVTGWRRVWARRRTDLQVGELAIGMAIADWVLTDAHGRPVRIPEGIAERFTEGETGLTSGRVAASAPDGAVTTTWRVRIRDLDPLAHVNNATYLDIIDGVLADASDSLTGPHPPVRYEAEYLRPATVGTRVDIQHWEDRRITSFVFQDPESRGLLRARVTSGS